MSFTLILKLRHYFKKLLYLFVLIGFSYSYAGAYEDFFTAIKRDDPHTVIALLKRGFDPNTLNPMGEAGLLLALREPSLKVLPELIKAPKINVEVRSLKEESPLMLASLKGFFEICQQLIAADEDVNKPGWAPLHYAASQTRLDVIQLLLDNNAYIDAESPNGTTPLMMAAQYGTPEAVKLLLEAGADPTLKNALGLTAFDFAQRAERPDSSLIIRNAIQSHRPKATW